MLIACVRLQLPHQLHTVCWWTSWSYSEWLINKWMSTVNLKGTSINFVQTQHRQNPQSTHSCIAQRRKECTSMIICQDILGQSSNLTCGADWFTLLDQVKATTYHMGESMLRLFWVMISGCSGWWIRLGFAAIWMLRAYLGLLQANSNRGSITSRQHERSVHWSLHVSGLAGSTMRHGGTLIACILLLMPARNRPDLVDWHHKRRPWPAQQNAHRIAM